MMAFRKQKKKRNIFVGAILKAISPFRAINSNNKKMIFPMPISDAYDYTGGSYPYVTLHKTGPPNLAKKNKRHSEVFDVKLSSRENEPRPASLVICDESRYLLRQQAKSSENCDEFSVEEPIYDVPLPIEDFENRISHLTELDGDKVAEMSGNRAIFRVNRRNAEMMLLRPDVAVGTYLLRPNDEEIIVLSVRSVSPKNEPDVIHIKVTLSNDGHCSVGPNEKFSNIDSLLSFYSETEFLFDGKPPVSLVLSYPRNFQKVQLAAISIPRSQVQLFDQIGAGNFGEVFRGKWHSLDVAVKSLKQNGLKPSQQSAILDEAKTMASVLHENLVKLIAVSVDEEPFLVITEFMNMGSLLDFMQNGSFLFSFHDLVDILKQIACGMAYLEAEKFLHRDLRAANCLVHQESPGFDVKIADFGLSAILDQDNTYESHSDKQVPVRWTAPEALLYKRFSNKSDVWSFGILVFEVFSLGALPYEGKNNFELWRFIDSGGRISLEDLHAIQKEATYLRRTMENQETILCPDLIYANLMANCWRVDPADRPSFQSLVSFIIDYENEHCTDSD